MLQLTKNILIYQDANYSHAVNFSGHLYNYPITLNFGEKHQRSKYILGAGTQDHITLLQDGIFIYCISENNGLSYISLQVFNTETRQEEGNVFLNDQDINTEENFCFGILDLQPEEQLELLFNYL